MNEPRDSSSSPRRRDGRCVRLVLAYDGTNYAGWQWQLNHPSIQAAVEAAILKITGESVRVVASGRTDAGVHALRQVANFICQSQLPCDAMHRALNAVLPSDIVVLELADAPPRYHAILDTVRKRYRYVIDDGDRPDIFLRNYAWHYREPLDADAMHRAAQAFVGTHDFASFQGSGSRRLSSIRTIHDVIVRRCATHELAMFATHPPIMQPSRVVTFEVEAAGFLYNMVRIMAGTLVEVGSGERNEAWPAEVLARRDRRAAGMTAPPQGLFLIASWEREVRGVEE